MKSRLLCTAGCKMSPAMSSTSDGHVHALGRYLLRAMIAALPALTLLAVFRGSAQAEDTQTCTATEPVHTWIIQSQDQNRSVDDRLKSYKSAIQACPGDAPLYAAIAGLLLQQQNPAGALEWAHRGLKVAPSDPDLEADVGVAQLAAGRPEEALSTLRTVAPSGRSFFYLGMTYRALRDPEHARAAFSNALEAGFDDPYLLYVLIEQDREAGEKQAGLDDFHTFYRKYPNSPWLHMLYGDAYSARHDNVEAEAEYKQAAQIEPHLPVVHYQLGFLAFARGDYSQAAGEFRQEITIDPTFAKAYLYLGTDLRRLGKNDEALPVLQQAVGRDPNFPLAYRSLAVSEIDAGKLPAALETLRAASRRFPQESAFPAQMSSLLKRLGRLQEAKDEAEKAQALSRTNNPVHAGVNEAELLDEPAGAAQKDSSDRAAANSLPSGHGGGSSAPSTVEGGTAATSGGSPPAASRQEVQSRKLDVSLLPLYECLERSDAACAKSKLNSIQGGVKASPDYLELEAKTFMLTQDRDAALADIARAVQLAPHEYRYLMTQGEIFQSFNDQPSAIRCFLQADRLLPHVSGTFYFLGMSFFFAEDYARAKKHFQEAWQLDPNNDRAAFMLGISNLIDFKLLDAKPYFEAALKLKPNNPFCHLHYGILLSRLGDNDGAIQQVRIAEKLDPSYALTHFNLGHLCKETGSYVEARQELETAVKLKPSLAAAYYQLGWVYHRLGMEAESRRAYQKFEEASLAEKRQVTNPMESDLVPANGTTEQR